MTTGLLQVLTLFATDFLLPEHMPSEIVTASLILTGGIVGSILYATRDRSIQYGGTGHLGRNEDKLNRKLDDIKRTLKNLV